MEYIIVIETKLKFEMFAFIEGIFSTKELDMPEFQIIGGEASFELSIFLYGLKLFLKSLGHSSSHCDYDEI